MTQRGKFYSVTNMESGISGSNIPKKLPKSSTRESYIYPLVKKKGIYNQM